MKLVVLWSLLLISAPATALAGVEQLAYPEFKSLVEELAQKVPLFQDAWKQDPKAEFYGGTSRDFLYWVKGRFQSAKNRDQAVEVMNELRKLPVIGTEEFIIGESDVDVITRQGVRLDPWKYNVRKIDAQNGDVFDPKTPEGRSEIDQGHIPAEKIRLSKQGFVQTPGFGDGVREIFEGKLSVSFSDPQRFAQSLYARTQENHPVLLALRYLRLQAVNYHQTYGDGYPQENLLKSGMDEQSARQVKRVIDETLDGSTLIPYLEKNRFRSWLNGTIQKGFRSYTNPTAMLHLAKAFGVDRLAEIYPGVEPLNQYVFRKFRDPSKVEYALKNHGAKAETLYVYPELLFPDGKLYHGTGSDQAFRQISLQGVLPSESGAAGKGLYGVSIKNRQVAEDWRGGGKELLLSFEVKPGAKIIDITQGEGARLWELEPGQSFDAFAERYGADILRYRMDIGDRAVEAFVVKNSAVLGRGEGVFRRVLPLSRILDEAPRIRTLQDLYDTSVRYALGPDEVAVLVKRATNLKYSLLEYVKMIIDNPKVSRLGLSQSTLKVGNREMGQIATLIREAQESHRLTREVASELRTLPSDRRVGAALDFFDFKDKIRHLNEGIDLFESSYARSEIPELKGDVDKLFQMLTSETIQKNLKPDDARVSAVVDLAKKVDPFFSSRSNDWLDYFRSGPGKNFKTAMSGFFKSCKEPCQHRIFDEVLSHPLPSDDSFIRAWIESGLPSWNFENYPVWEKIFRLLERPDLKWTESMQAVFDRVHPGLARRIATKIAAVPELRSDPKVKRVFASGMRKKKLTQEAIQAPATPTEKDQVANFESIRNRIEALEKSDEWSGRERKIWADFVDEDLAEFLSSSSSSKSLGADGDAKIERVIAAIVRVRGGGISRSCAANVRESLKRLTE